MISRILITIALGFRGCEYFSVGTDGVLPQNKIEPNEVDASKFIEP